MADVEIRKKALAMWTGEDLEDIEEAGYDHYGIPVLTAGGQDYAVATDEEADEAVREYIRGSVWAFRAEFILDFCNLPIELAEAIQAFQESRCEGANDALLALIEACGDFEDFVEEAVEADGRGHFLATYDGEEHEVQVDGETFYIYIL